MPTCTSDTSILANEVSACNIKTALVNLASELCTDIEALDPLTNIALNVNTATTDMLAAAATLFEISDVVTTELPAGSIVGDTIVTAFSGVYRLALQLNIPTSGIAETFTFDILVNGLVDTQITLTDDGINPIVYSNEFYKAITAGDIISFQGTSPTGTLAAVLASTVELVIGSA